MNTLDEQHDAAAAELSDQKEAAWLLMTASLACTQLGINNTDEALDFAKSCYEDIDGDIELESPQDCIDGELDAMRADAI